ncbi:DnaJ domain [Musa troglodytarum]|uniref:DnaJ domain n=1 Tax=Musa troglodytarum TaxID=320322 RepID=A0A9E7F3X8_9LILI|nr:DnaJ domain [Musa troglodytarum]
MSIARLDPPWTTSRASWFGTSASAPRESQLPWPPPPVADQRILGSDRADPLARTAPGAIQGPAGTPTPLATPGSASGAPKAGTHWLTTMSLEVRRGPSASSSPPPAFDSIFDGYDKGAGAEPSSSSSLPVYDKPVFDDCIFNGIPGVKSSSSFEYDDVFSSISSGPNRVSSSPFEDLLENLGKPMPESKKGASDGRSAEEKDRDLSDFDDLIPGFGGAVLPRKLNNDEMDDPHCQSSRLSQDGIYVIDLWDWREFPEANKQKPSVSSAKPPATMAEDPFVVLESESPSTNPLSGKLGTNLPPRSSFNVIEILPFPW